jgi:hypothetical protein
VFHRVVSQVRAVRERLHAAVGHSTDIGKYYYTGDGYKENMIHNE